jgi:hypothetical protein
MSNFDHSHRFSLRIWSNTAVILSIQFLDVFPCVTAHILPEIPPRVSNKDTKATIGSNIQTNASRNTQKVAYGRHPHPQPQEPAGVIVRLRFGQPESESGSAAAAPVAFKIDPGSLLAGSRSG